MQNLPARLGFGLGQATCDVIGEGEQNACVLIRDERDSRGGFLTADPTRSGNFLCERIDDVLIGERLLG